jgi:hypothetical protein
VPTGDDVEPERAARTVDVSLHPSGDRIDVDPGYIAAGRDRGVVAAHLVHRSEVSGAIANVAP